MNTIVIAEDEKMIRKGLAAMVQRAPVPVETILEARDGRQALELLQSRPVDLLITDVRMPEMDGIQLVEQVQALPDPPMVLVISGYDDFSYAVSMLRNGVQDYLLKPVEREKLYEVLTRIQSRLDSRLKARRSGQERYLLALRYLMLNNGRDDPQKDGLLREYADQFFEQPYVAVCTREDRLLPEGTLLLHNMEELGVVLGPADRLQSYPWQGTTGISRPQTGLESLYTAHAEAFSAWKQSFLAGNGVRRYTKTTPLPLQATAEQLTGLVQLGRWREAVARLDHVLETAATGEVSADEAAALCGAFARSLADTCRGLFDQGDSPLRFEPLWSFPSAAAYRQGLAEWLEQISQRTGQDYADYESKQKIRRAVAYVQENFRAPINMAVVSNHVSMNYSLFSLLFKQYTGANFVSYLQNLRIEEAKRLLTDTDMRVNEVSARAGFSGEKHFLKVFKAATGLSPTDWRKVSRQRQP